MRIDLQSFVVALHRCFQLPEAIQNSPQIVEREYGLRIDFHNPAEAGRRILEFTLDLLRSP